MQLTEEQELIISQALTGKNMLVEARAGAAKTTTLIKIAETLSTKSGLALAFNAKIRDELKIRLPANFKAQTLNGCGLQAWQRYIGKACKVDTDKCYRLFKAAIEARPKNEAEFLWDTYNDLRSCYSAAKTSGYVPGPLAAAYKPLILTEDFYNIALDLELSPVEREVLEEVLAASWQETIRGVVDFDDMLLAPAIAPVRFPPLDVLLVDEAQDLSMINHVLVRKLAAKQIIAVGDPCQAIYGFRGADHTSMDTLGRLFSTETFYLTMSFRCSAAVCSNARWRAPDMRSPDWATPGEVRHLASWDLSTIPDGAAVLCRNNSPLFSLAIKLLKGGRVPELKGRDVVKSVIAKMKKLGKLKLPRDEALAALAEWEKAELKRQRDARKVRDLVECIQVFLNEAETLGGAIDFASALSAQAGRITLLTGHGSKGLEFDHVYFLNADLIDLDYGQDKNIKYVIETRAKQTLTYINSEGLIE